MQNGMKKEFGSGKSLDIWQDHWIMDSFPRPPIVKSRVNALEVSLSMLKDEELDEWIIPRLKACFNEEDVKAHLSDQTREYRSRGWLLLDF